jgi:hypothetical protein
MGLQRWALLRVWVLLLPLAASSQQVSSQSRIVGPVDEGALVALRGNTHPLAQPQFDRGPAPPDLPMARMLLVLKRSPAQEAALEKLLDDQQDLNSPSYHQWLTPDQFGQQFGPSDQDIQTIAAWLRSHGFQVAAPSRGRTVIEFSGTAAQVQQAFHTEIHKFTVNGQDHWANVSDPQIPAALAPVVEGVASLHNFPKRPMYRLAKETFKPAGVGGANSSNSEFTIPASQCAISGNCYFVGPYDFATIYNVLPLWNATPPIDGTGQTIAILAESNISIGDVENFRSMFGLPANDPQVIVNGLNPGQVPDTETEADLDVEWSGAVAKGATIKLVVSAPTTSTAGVDLSAVYAIEKNVAPIISESFGECELFLGNAGNSFQNLIRQQAAAQGITFINSSGDEGSARCDPFSGSTPDPATHGLAVSGLASSPNGVAVGGTDFQNFGPNFSRVASPYWNLNNDANSASAKGYIPETTWNSNCTNNVFVILGAGASPEGSCNNPRLVKSVYTGGGGGGRSSCTVSDGINPSSCSSGYAKPSWQSAPGVPADGVRDIPDVSLFASSGFMDSSYIICQADQILPAYQPCSLSAPFGSFLAIGGTSASAPAFAGILALVNQFTNSSGLGNANYALYKMASSSVQTSHTCGATLSPSPQCIFYDVTSGTNEVPCATGSPNCDTSNDSDLFGVLSGYSAAAGYDLATGLGSVNAFNLAHNWMGPTTKSMTTLSMSSQNGTSPISITHGQNVNFDIAVAPSAATGVVSLEGSPTGSGTVPMASFTLENGVASGTTSALAGGSSYSVKAHYSGNGTYQPSDSGAVTVTVAPEPSKTIITLPIFDPNTGRETGNTPTSVVYGSPMLVRVDVGNSQASQTFPEQPVCAPLTCPTGSITLTDTVNGFTVSLPTPATGFVLNSGSFLEVNAVPPFGAALFDGGPHQLTANYPGDNSYLQSTGTYTFTVTPAPTQMTPPFLGRPSIPALVGNPIDIGVTVSATSSFPAQPPTGTITFYDGTALLGVGSLSTQNSGSPFNPAFSTGGISPTFTTSGVHQISASYGGDANFQPTNAPAASISILFGTSITASANPTTIGLGGSVNVTATVTSTGKTLPMTGTFQFLGLSSPVPGMPGTNGSGFQILTATVTMVPQNSGEIDVTYSGDTNYQSGYTVIFVNVGSPEFSVTVGSPNLTITAGQTATTQLTLTPTNNFGVTDPVTLSCSSIYLANVTCSFNPPSPLTLTSTKAVSTTLSITTLLPSSNLMTTLVFPHRPGWKKIWPPASWALALADALAILLLSLWSGKRYRRLAMSLGMACLLFLAVGCESSGGGNGGGGGRGGPTPTSVTLTTSSVKVPSGTTLTLTATVHSTNAVTGYVDFIDPAFAIPSAQVINSVATEQLGIGLVGTHTISARYRGDSNNQASQTSGTLNVVITGTGQLTVNASGIEWGPMSNINITVQ